MPGPIIEVSRPVEKALLASKLKMKVQRMNVNNEQVKDHKLQVSSVNGQCDAKNEFLKTPSQNQLMRHKESLRKIILKKRDLLEKDLQSEIQKELSTEMAIHIKNICAKEETKIDKEPSKYMKKK